MIKNMVAANITSWVAYGPCVVRRFHGWNAGADRFIQLHAKPAADIANADVPAVKSFYAQGANFFDYCPSEDVPLSELSIGISSTEPNYTAAGANTGVDMTLEIDTLYPVSTTPLVTTRYGDLATGRDSLALWTDAAAFANADNALLRVDWTNGGSDPAWLMLFANIPTAGDKPIRSWGGPTGLLPGVSLPFFFGLDGTHPENVDATRVRHTGGYLYQSSTGDVLTATADAASYIRAIANTQ